MRHPSKFLTTDSDSEWSIYHVDTKFVKLSVIITEIIEMLTCLQFLARAISDFVSEGVKESTLVSLGKGYHGLDY